VERLQRRRGRCGCGERVEDVTSHPRSVRRSSRSPGSTTMQHDPAYADVLTRPGPNGPVGTSFVAPTSYEDLVGRREAFLVWSERRWG